MSDTVALIDFHGDKIHSVLVDGTPFVALKPVLDSIGVDVWTQFRKLKSRSWANYRQLPVVAEDGRIREMITVDVRTLLMLLATINEDRVSEAVRPKLIAYQSESVDVINAYWTTGGAINPRATDEQLDRLIQRAEGQMRVLRMMDGVVSKAWLEAKMRHVAARALGEEPEIPPEDRPLTTSEYLEDKGLREVDIRSCSSQFGKYVKAMYVMQYGADPDKVLRFIDGTTREVYGYCEKHRPLFDAVWETHYESRS